MFINEPAFLNDLRELVKIVTVRKSAEEGMPFGKGIYDGFMYLKKIAQREGLTCRYYDGYALDISYGEGEVFGFLCHIDTVACGDLSQWMHEPYDMSIEEGILYGRGVNDNKGPLMLILHYLIALKQQNVQPKMTIRLIVGGAEETTWEGIHYYFKHAEMPKLGISPDGNFPIVYCEKGIRFYHVTGTENHLDIQNIESRMNDGLVCEACLLKDQKTDHHYIGKAAPSRHPERGDNAVLKMINDYDKPLELFHQVRSFYHEINQQSDMTCNISGIFYDKKRYDLYFDLRWASDKSEQAIDKIVQDRFSGDVHVREKSKKRLYVDPKDEFIKKLSCAYEEVMGEKPKKLIKGGASYARVLEKGIAFGPCFSGEVPNQHLPNESQSLSSLYKALTIYDVMLRKCGVLDEIENYGDHSIIT